MNNYRINACTYKQIEPCWYLHLLPWQRYLPRVYISERVWSNVQLFYPRCSCLFEKKVMLNWYCIWMMYGTHRIRIYPYTSPSFNCRTIVLPRALYLGHTMEHLKHGPLCTRLTVRLRIDSDLKGLFFIRILCLKIRDHRPCLTVSWF